MQHAREQWLSGPWLRNCGTHNRVSGGRLEMWKDRQVGQVQKDGNVHGVWTSLPFCINRVLKHGTDACPEKMRSRHDKFE